MRQKLRSGAHVRTRRFVLSSQSAQVAIGRRCHVRLRRCAATTDPGRACSDACAACWLVVDLHAVWVSAVHAVRMRARGARAHTHARTRKCAHTDERCGLLCCTTAVKTNLANQQIETCSLCVDCRRGGRAPHAHMQCRVAAASQ